MARSKEDKALFIAGLRAAAKAAGLEEGQLASHNCQEEAAVSLIAWIFCPLCEEALERGEACGIARHNLEHEGASA